MADAEGIGDHLTIGRGAVAGGLLDIQDGFHHRHGHRGGVERSSPAHAVGILQASDIIQGGQALVTGFVIHPHGEGDYKAVVVGHVVTGVGDIAKVEDHVAARNAAGSGDGRSGQRAGEVGSQAAAGGRGGINGIIEVGQAGGQQVGDDQVGGDAFRQGDQQVKSGGGADREGGRGGAELLDGRLHREDHVGRVGCHIVVQGAHAAGAVALAVARAGRAGGGGTGRVGGGTTAGQAGVGEGGGVIDRRTVGGGIAHLDRHGQGGCVAHIQARDGHRDILGAGVGIVHRRSVGRQAGHHHIGGVLQVEVGLERVADHEVKSVRAVRRNGGIAHHDGVGGQVACVQRSGLHGFVDGEDRFGYIGGDGRGGEKLRAAHPQRETVRQGETRLVADLVQHQGVELDHNVLRVGVGIGVGHIAEFEEHVRTAGVAVAVSGGVIRYVRVGQRIGRRDAGHVGLVAAYPRGGADGRVGADGGVGAVAVGDEGRLGSVIIEEAQASGQDILQLHIGCAAFWPGQGQAVAYDLAHRQALAARHAGGVAFGSAGDGLDRVGGDGQAGNVTAVVIVLGRVARTAALAGICARCAGNIGAGRVSDRAGSRQAGIEDTGRVGDHISGRHRGIQGDGVFDRHRAADRDGRHSHIDRFRRQVRGVGVRRRGGGTAREGDRPYCGQIDRQGGQVIHQLHIKSGRRSAGDACIGVIDRVGDHIAGVAGGGADGFVVAGSAEGNVRLLDDRHHPG